MIIAVATIPQLQNKLNENSFYEMVSLMKTVPLYKNRIISLPFEAVNDKLSTATNDELKVLIAVFSRDEFDIPALAAELDMTENSFRRSLDMWQNAGALIYDTLEDKSVDNTKKSQKPQKTPVQSSDTSPKKKKSSVEMRTSFPRYTSEELAEAMSRVTGAPALLDSCQQTLGRIFNTAEASKVIALSEQFSLPNDYILLLCQYAASIDKKSVQYITKLAMEFYDRDIVSYVALEEEIDLIKARRSYESFVRGLFGIGRRYLIKKEKDIFYKWIEKYHFSRDMIEKAYEITILRKNEPNISYANAILENWYSAGLKTPEDVEKSEQERNPKPVNNSTFETDEFFQAALLRSYQDETSGGNE